MGSPSWGVPGALPGGWAFASTRRPAPEVVTSACRAFAFKRTCAFAAAACRGSAPWRSARPKRGRRVGEADPHGRRRALLAFQEKPFITARPGASPGGAAAEMCLLLRSLRPRPCLRGRPASRRFRHGVQDPQRCVSWARSLRSRIGEVGSYAQKRRCQRRLEVARRCPDSVVIDARRACFAGRRRVLQLRCLPGAEDTAILLRSDRTRIRRMCRRLRDGVRDTRRDGRLRRL